MCDLVQEPIESASLSLVSLIDIPQYLRLLKSSNLTEVLPLRQKGSTLVLSGSSVFVSY